MAQYAQVAAGSPAADWEIERVGDVGPDSCASLTLDAPRELVVMVARPTLEAPGGIDESVSGNLDLDAIDAGIDALYDGYWEPSECVAPGQLDARVDDLVRDTALAGFDVVVRPPPASADSCVALVDVRIDDTEIVFRPVPTSTD